MVESVSVPSLKGCFLEVEMDSNSSELVGMDAMFEPQLELLKSYGLDSHELLVKIQDNGHVLVPVQNTDGGCSVKFGWGY